MCDCNRIQVVVPTAEKMNIQASGLKMATK